MDISDDQSYTIDELADISGFDKRVIRSFIEQGLLSGPESMGRYARYSAWHLTRLLAIRELKERRGLQLSEVRRSLISMSTEQISELAQSSQTGTVLSTPNSTALDYIRALQKSPAPPLQSPANGPPYVAPPQPAQSVSPNVTTGTTAIDQLLLDLSNLAQGQRVRRQAKADGWMRIAITPDIELSIRGATDPDQLTTLERIADHLRELLLRGTNV